MKILPGITHICPVKLGIYSRGRGEVGIEGANDPPATQTKTSSKPEKLPFNCLRSRYIKRDEKTPQPQE